MTLAAQLNSERILNQLLLLISLLDTYIIEKVLRTTVPVWDDCQSWSEVVAKSRPLKPPASGSEKQVSVLRTPYGVVLKCSIGHGKRVIGAEG